MRTRTTHHTLHSKLHVASIPKARAHRPYDSGVHTHLCASTQEKEQHQDWDWDTQGPKQDPANLTFLIVAHGGNPSIFRAPS